MIPAYSYLRVSGNGQVEGDGPERQRLTIQKWAAANGYQIIGEYFDGGVSGTKELEHREALSRLIDQLRTGPVKAVVIEKLDRLARDLVVSEKLIEVIRKTGSELISTAEPDLMANDPSRKLIRQILSAIAEFDRSNIVLRLRGARQRMKARTGRCEGKKPFGEHPQHPHERNTLEAMRLLRAAGMGWTEIAATLNSGGHQTRQGGSWRASTVHKVLSRG